MIRAARGLAHGAGALGILLVGALAVGVTVPPAEEFPDSLLSAFHTFFVGILFHPANLPDAHHPGWRDWVEPGDVLFVSRGHVAWGEWSHVAVVTRAPDDARWIEPGTLSVLDASIHDGMYYASLDYYRDYPRVVVRRASHDPAVRARIAEAVHAHRHRIFVGVAREGAPYSNCTKSAIDALASVGLDAGLTGWRTPDELYRSEVWVD